MTNAGLYLDCLSMRKQIVRGHLDLLVMAVIADGFTYGWAIADEIRTRSDGEFDLPEGTIYPALYRLEDAGFLTSDWAEVDGRRRRMYALSKRGKAAFADRKTEWDVFARAVSRVVRMKKAWPATT